jgi:hypothetical protein
MALTMKLLGQWLPGPVRRWYVAGIARRRAKDRAGA